MWQVVALVLALAAPVQVSSVKLWNDYRKDPAAADKLYRDRETVVTGRVREVSATYTLYLEGGPGQVDGVTASPAPGQIEALARHHVGDIAGLVCTGAGLAFNEPILLNCKVP